MVPVGPMTSRRCSSARGMSGSLGFGVDLLDGLGLQQLAFDRHGLSRSTMDNERPLHS